MLDGELQERYRKRVELNLQFAKFPFIKRLSDFDFEAQPSVDRRLIDELKTGRYLSEGRNIQLHRQLNTLMQTLVAMLGLVTVHGQRP